MDRTTYHSRNLFNCGQLEQTIRIGPFNSISALILVWLVQAFEVVFESCAVKCSARQKTPLAASAVQLSPPLSLLVSEGALINAQ